MRKAQIPTAHQFGELFSELLKSAGHDALHTRQLPAQNRTTDEVLKRISVTEQRMVGTKDLDFFIPISSTEGLGNCCSFAPATSVRVTARHCSNGICQRLSPRLK